MNLKELKSSIRSFLVKESDAPMSADSHMAEVLFSVIEEMGG